jgi:GNAT superfamily N-acetyltransferase
VDVRPAVVDDVPAMQEIERQAGELFRDVGMPTITDDPPLDAQVLEAFVDDARAWVIDGPDGDAAAYLLIEAIDDGAHIVQVSVRPEHGRRGLGRQLVDRAEEWARAQGLRSLTLTTFRDVPWNGPYYARLGFTTVPVNEQGPQLRAIVEAERRLEEGNGPRITQRRAIAR